MKIVHFAFILLFVFAVGCGGNVSVTGTVEFSDGTPVDRGMVVFETEKMAARGDIRKDGTYTLTTGEDKGIPPGTYKVSITGVNMPIITPPVYASTGAQETQTQVIPQTNPINAKYENPNTSGLTCEVKGKTTFDIKVEKP